MVLQESSSQGDKKNWCYRTKALLEQWGLGQVCAQAETEVVCNLKTKLEPELYLGHENFRNRRLFIMLRRGTNSLRIEQVVGIRNRWRRFVTFAWQANAFLLDCGV